MSSTNRGAERRADDAYETPAWCVHRLLDTGRFTRDFDRTWYEPACGSGAIIRAVNAWFARRAGVEPGFQVGPRWHAQDIRQAAIDALLDQGPVVAVANVGDFLTSPNPWRAGVIITNPPFSLAQQFVERALKECNGQVAMLLRLGWLSSAERALLLRETPPDVYVLPNRPSFTGNGSTDSADYCWAVWPSVETRDRDAGAFQVLETTPLEVRRHVRAEVRP